MRKFDEIWDISAARKGGDDALTKLLSFPKSYDDLVAIPDDRWLSQAAQMIFNAGFNWKVVENKWPGFEKAFYGFDLDKVAYFHDDDFDRLLADKDIIRNGQKLHAVQENAVYFRELSAEHDGLGRFFASYPAQDYILLLEELKKNGARLGGNSGGYFLRYMGVDGFILSQDVTARLIAEGVIDKAATSKSAMRKVQDAFNQWQAQSGRSLTEISRVLAMSV